MTCCQGIGPDAVLHALVYRWISVVIRPALAERAVQVEERGNGLFGFLHRITGRIRAPITTTPKIKAPRSVMAAARREYAAAA